MLAVVLTASAAQASPILPGQFLKFADAPGTTGGGEFKVTQVNSNGSPVLGAWEFLTFCIQRTQYMDFSSVFAVQSVSTSAITDSAANGGVNGADPLDPRTAYLYTLFRSDALNGYVHDNQHANELQIAFWMIEQEVKPGDGTGLWNVNNVYYTMATNAVNQGLWSGLGNVRALNIRYRTVNGTEAQDQLALVTPEPASLVLLASGLSLAAARIRRRPRSR